MSGNNNDLPRVRTGFLGVGVHVQEICFFTFCPSTFQELHGDPSSMSVPCGNAQAEVAGENILPFAEYLDLTTEFEQPTSSLFFGWDSKLDLHYILVLDVVLLSGRTWSPNGR